MRFENHIPIYLQIISLIKRDLVLGIKKPGDKLESVREYAIYLKVNPNTVQKAYQEMERLNLAYTKRGIGRFIVEDDFLVESLQDEMSTEIISQCVGKMKELGFSNESIIKNVKEVLNGGNA